MDTFIGALIAVPVLFFFVWRYTKKRTPVQRGAAVPTTLDSYASAAPTSGAPSRVHSAPVAAPAAVAAPARVPRKLGVPGEDLGKVAYQLVEAEKYSGVDILVVGGGDAAVEAALTLCLSGKNRVTVAYRGAEFTRPDERNREQLLAAETEGRLTVLRNTNLLGIKPQGVLLQCGGKIRELPNGYVFILIGGASPEELSQRAGSEIVETEMSVHS